MEEYINVYNEAGNLSLSCAMSQLGVKLDDDLVGYSMYYDPKITKSTTSSLMEMLQKQHSN